MVVELAIIFLEPIDLKFANFYKLKLLERLLTGKH